MYSHLTLKELIFPPSVWAAGLMFAHPQHNKPDRSASLLFSYRSLLMLLHHCAVSSFGCRHILLEWKALCCTNKQTHVHSHEFQQISKDEVKNASWKMCSNSDRLLIVITSWNCVQWLGRVTGTNLKICTFSTQNQQTANDDLSVQCLGLSFVLDGRWWTVRSYSILILLF